MVDKYRGTTSNAEDLKVYGTGAVLGMLFLSALSYWAQTWAPLIAGAFGAVMMFVMLVAIVKFLTFWYK